MKQWLIWAVGIYALCATPVFAEGPIKATTESGKPVILYSDGTWKYAEQEKPPMSQGQGFSRSVEATEKVEFAGGKYAIFFNPGKWKLGRSEETGRLSWIHRNGDGYVMVISERIPIPLENLRKIALNNAKEAAPNVKITFEQKRQVNSREVLCLQMKGTIQGIDFVYFGYYYSGTGGTVQLLTYTAESLFEEYRNDFEEFLNGFEVIG
jgi:hypothetical protein